MSSFSTKDSQGDKEGTGTDSEVKINSHLDRQSSVHSLTLSEFQTSLSRTGKSFSFSTMNMDEFLNSIWSAQENPPVQDHDTTHTAIVPTPFPVQAHNYVPIDQNQEMMLPNQPNFLQQGLFNNPETLCLKTVEEVWADLHNHDDEILVPVQNMDMSEKLPSYGEMTLEDFLVRIGIVREQKSRAQQLQPFQFGRNQNINHLAYQPNSTVRPQLMEEGGYVNNVTASHRLQGGMQEGGVRYPHEPLGVHSRGILNGIEVEYIGPPEGPHSIDNINRIRGGQRCINRPPDIVVQRRQQRMIYNRESAARSRARKQAYIEELEEELKLHKRENVRLRQSLASRRARQQQAEFARERQQQCDEEEESSEDENVMGTKSQRIHDKIKATRSLSCPC